MMGPQPYLDPPFADELVVIGAGNYHDCMWSGECYVCQQPSRVHFQNSNSSAMFVPPIPPPNLDGCGTIAVTAGGGSGSSPAGSKPAASSAASMVPEMAPYCENKNHLLPVKLAVDSPQLESARVRAIPDCNTFDGPTPTKLHNLRSCQSSPDSPIDLFVTPRADSRSSTRLQVVPERDEQNSECSEASFSPLADDSSNKTTPSLRTGPSHRHGSFCKSNGGHSSVDNKKLRHREVEKNRHRQLQAMVKTLSEKIPGKVEKETQVQTMKRAARYCVYLRNITPILTHVAHTQPLVIREKLEKIYQKSFDQVELIMAQNPSMR